MRAKTFPFSLTLAVLLATFTSARAQLILETKNALQASATPIDYKTTLVPGRYTASVRSSDLRPVLELLDDADNVLIARESASRTRPLSVEMKFIVHEGGIFTLRVRSSSVVEADGRFHVVLAHAAEPAPAPVNRPTETAPPSNREQQVVDLVNEERKKMGLPPLRVSAKLAQAARRHSANMARQNTGSHELDGAGPGERIREAGYRALQWGENIAWGAQTPEQAMSGWMNSPGHRRNILSSDVSEIGVGVAESNSGVLYWTQVFGTPGQ